MNKALISGITELGTGEEVTIRNLATMVTMEAGFTGQIEWNTTKPNGQPRRCLDVSRANEHFAFQAKHALRKGLKKRLQPQTSPL